MQLLSGAFRKLLLFFLVLLIVPSGHSQATSPDIYASMLGDWVGYDDTALNGAAKHIPVELKIIRGKDWVRMDYTYARRGEADFSKATKFMKLDLRRSEMTLSWDEPLNSGESYKTKGLDEFARTGLGTFTATGPAVGSGGGRGMFAFGLTSGALVYKWLNETAPGVYTIVTTFSLHRQI